MRLHVKSAYTVPSCAARAPSQACKENCPGCEYVSFVNPVALASIPGVSDVGPMMMVMVMMMMMIYDVDDDDEEEEDLMRMILLTH